MPFIVPFIPAILGGLSAATSIGHLFGGGGGGDAAALQRQQQADALKAKQQERLAAQKAIKGAEPDVQSATGGSLLDVGRFGLSPLLQQAGVQAGYPGAGYGIEGLFGPAGKATPPSGKDQFSNLIEQLFGTSLSPGQIEGPSGGLSGGSSI